MLAANTDHFAYMQRVNKELGNTRRYVTLLSLGQEYHHPSQTATPNDVMPPFLLHFLGRLGESLRRKQLGFAC